MLKISKISFPGLGIGEFEIDSVAFSIGKFDIAWYAIIICIGMIAAVSHLLFRAKQVGISSDTIIDFTLFTIPVGIIGARLYYVIWKADTFDSFLDVINIRSGGLAIYGGILAGALTVYIVSRFKKIPFLVIADCCTPGIILAQAIGRWGNFTNGEAFGGVTDWFCRMGLTNDLTDGMTLYVHPTFLYESLWNLIGFIIANIFHNKRKYDGQVFLFIFGWYGLGRMFIEGLRSDSLYASIFGLEFRVSQVLAAAIFTACLAALIYFAIKKPTKKLYYNNNSKTTKTEE